MQNLIIYGTGTFAAMMRYLFEEQGKYKVVCFCADKAYIKSDQFDKLPLKSFENIEETHRPEEYVMFVAVGYTVMRNRVAMFNRAVEKEYRLVNYISDKATIDRSVEIGCNNVILQGAQIEPFAKLGDNNIVWSSVNICHNAVISGHSFLACRSIVGGFATIHHNCFLGFGAIVLQNVRIAHECLIGASALVKNDTDPYGVYLGVPAIRIKEHKEDGVCVK